jgi:phage-related protein
MSWRAEFVVLTNGKIPFNDFLNELDIDSKIDIFAAIDELIEWKNNKMLIPQSKSKYLRNKIYEMRVRHKNILSRSLYFYYHEQRMVFTNGFIKKSEKAPNTEIEKAERLRKFYISQKGDSNDRQ